MRSPIDQPRRMNFIRMVAWSLYLAFNVLRRLLANILRVTYSKGYTDTNSKLSILASRSGGQKKLFELFLNTSAATINL
ncbi:hypothetical protein KPH14_007081 [Odynerus spinipes]|uniref:Uncharacterized protein n=1 Tax=Odynerus spinipes TaxID=1348599 RepID=A0AAD9RSU5_9HYME|nr:hypothetical protein KPH14_007081 [Odynerus spinipes]